MAAKTNLSVKLKYLRSLMPKLLLSTCMLGSASAIGYLINDLLTDFIYSTAPDQLPITPPGGNMVVEVSLSFGLVASIPFFFWLMARSLRRRAQDKEHVWVSLITPTSAVLAIAGLIISYFVLLPRALQILVSIREAFTGKPPIPGNEYFGFVIVYLVGFALLFQMPIVLYALSRFRDIKTRALLKFEPYAIAASLIVAGLLTPTTDTTHQIELAAPIVAMYQIGVIWVWLVNKRRKPEVGKIKLVPPFTLNIPEDALLETAGKPLNVVTAKTKTAPKVVTAPIKAANKAPVRYQGVGYARQPVSYQTRPGRRLINDFTPN